MSHCQVERHQQKRSLLQSSRPWRFQNQGQNTNCESWWPEYNESGDQSYRVSQIAYAARSVAGESLKEVVNYSFSSVDSCQA